MGTTWVAHGHHMGTTWAAHGHHMAILKQWAAHRSSLCLYQYLRLAPTMIIICLVLYYIRGRYIKVMCVVLFRSDRVCRKHTAEPQFHMYTQEHIHACTCTHIHTCTKSHMHTHAHTCTHECRHPCTPTSTCTSRHVHMRYYIQRENCNNKGILHVRTHL